MAKIINNAHGAPVIAAWDVLQLDDAWLYTFIGLADLPRRQAPRQAIQREFTKFEQSHPTFRKTH